METVTDDVTISEVPYPGIFSKRLKNYHIAFLFKDFMFFQNRSQMNFRATYMDQFWASLSRQTCLDIET